MDWLFWVGCGCFLGVRWVIKDGVLYYNGVSDSLGLINEDCSMGVRVFWWSFLSGALGHLFYVVNH